MYSRKSLFTAMSATLMAIAFVFTACGGPTIGEAPASASSEETADISEEEMVSKVFELASENGMEIPDEGDLKNRITVMYAAGEGNNPEEIFEALCGNGYFSKEVEPLPHINIGSGEGEGEISDDTSPASTDELTREYPIISNIYGEIPLGFSEGRAWVEYRSDDSDKNVGVINEDGELIYRVDFESFTNDIASENTGYNIAAVPFENGLSYYYACYWDAADIRPGFVIIDKDGNELFTSNDGDENTEFYICGCHDGNFVVEENIATFDENKSYIYTMDAYGNLTSEKAEITGFCPPWFSLEYWGDGIFLTKATKNGRGNDVIFNTNTMQLFYPGPKLLPIVDGIGLTYSGRIISVESMANKEVWDASSNTKGSAAEKGEYFYDSQMQNYVCLRNDAYFDYLGNQVAVVPSFSDQVKILACGQFSGDYAPIDLLGADGKEYVSVFDRSGQLAYDPVPASIINNDFYRRQYSYHGYLLALNEDNDSVVITPQGVPLISGKDDLSELGEDAVLEGYNGTVLQDGFFIFKSSDRDKNTELEKSFFDGLPYYVSDSGANIAYVSLDGKKIINCVKVRQ